MFSCVVLKGEGATRRELKVFPKNMSSSDQFAIHLKGNWTTRPLTNSAPTNSAPDQLDRKIYL